MNYEQLSHFLFFISIDVWRWSILTGSSFDLFLVSRFSLVVSRYVLSNPKSSNFLIPHFLFLISYFPHRETLYRVKKIALCCFDEVT